VPLKGIRELCKRLGLVLVCLPDGTYCVHGRDRIVDTSS
jgi:hypothetical protein